MIFGDKKKDALEPEVRQRDNIIQYKKVFGGEAGREVLFDLLDRHHFLSTKELTPFQNGQRAVVADLLVRCNISVAELDKLLKGEPV